MRKYRIVICAALALALAGCSSAAPATQSSTSETVTSAGTSTATSPASTSKPTAPSSSTSSSAPAELAALCAKHCDKLQALDDLPACSSYVACAGQITEASKAVTAFLNDFSDTSLDMGDYPKLKDAAQGYIDTSSEWADRDCTEMKPDGSDLAVVCGMGAYSVKVGASLVGIILQGLAA